MSTGDSWKTRFSEAFYDCEENCRRVASSSGKSGYLLLLLPEDVSAASIGYPANICKA